MLHLTVMIGTEGLDTLEMEKVDSSLPATWLMSEIMRQMDERYHVIGLEDKKGEPIAYVVATYLSSSLPSPPPSSLPSPPPSPSKALVHAHRLRASSFVHDPDPNLNLIGTNPWAPTGTVTPP